MLKLVLLKKEGRYTLLPHARGIFTPHEVVALLGGVGKTCKECKVEIYVSPALKSNSGLCCECYISKVLPEKCPRCGSEHINLANVSTRQFVCYQCRKYFTVDGSLYIVVKE